jgi:hypothetical protein
MENNFSTPVSMEYGENMDFLKRELKALGYEWKDYSEQKTEAKFIATCYDMTENSAGITSKPVLFGRILLTTYNPDLFLALAAMRDGDEPHLGEWFICIKDYDLKNPIRRRKGDLVKTIEDENSCSGLTFGPTYNRKYIRKATKEEIIAHFKEKKEERKIIGYKAPCDLYGGSVKAGTIFVKGRGGAASWYQPKDRGSDSQSVPMEIVEMWEPIYEERTEKIKLKSFGGEFELEVSIKGIRYAPDDKWLLIIDLERIVHDAFNAPRLSTVCSPSTYPISYSHANLGCKHEVPIQDIKKVLDVYKIMTQE